MPMAGIRWCRRFAFVVDLLFHEPFFLNAVCHPAVAARFTSSGASPPCASAHSIPSESGKRDRAVRAEGPDAGAIFDLAPSAAGWRNSERQNSGVTASA